MDASRALMFAGLSLLCIVAFRLTYRMSVASTKKAQQLALALGYSEADAARIEVPPGTRALGRPGWGLAIAFIPLLAWGATGLVLGKFLWADAHSRPLEALRNMSGSNANSVSRVLDEMGPVTPAGVEVYRKYMSDPASEVRYGAAMALAKIGDAGKAGIPELINGLKDEKKYVCQRCASTLIQFGGGYEAGVDNLIQMLDDPGDEINSVLTRDLAAQALGKLGPAAKNAIPMLEKAQKSKWFHVRKSADAALEKIRPVGGKDVGKTLQGM